MYTILIDRYSGEISSPLQMRIILLQFYLLSEFLTKIYLCSDFDNLMMTV